MLFLINILHQTATSFLTAVSSKTLFLINILHQTATTNRRQKQPSSCSLSIFYIKPQLYSFRGLPPSVVPYQYSTSNRNPQPPMAMPAAVVPYQYSTSNRNSPEEFQNSFELFLINILHQTATHRSLSFANCCCSLSIFYIKPQPNDVPLLAPFGCSLSIFYIKPQPWFIHHVRRNSCSLSIFYIKPQLFFYWLFPSFVVPYQYSTSNRNDGLPY